MVITAAGIVILISILFFFQSIEAKPIKIGGVLFLTGNQAFLGQQVRNGIELARAELAAQKNPIEVFYEDSRDTPRDAIAAFSRLLSLQDVPLVVTTGDVVTLSLIPVAEREKVVLFATVASTSDLPKGHPLAFRYSTTTDSNAEVMVDFIGDRLKLKRVAALYINNDFGIAWLAKAKSLLKEKGVTLSGEQSYAIDAQNLRAQIASLLADKPDALLISGFGPAYAVGIIQTREQAPDLPIVADATFSVPFFQKQAGSAAEGVFFASTIFDAAIPATPEIEKFIQSYQKAYEMPPELTSALGYDTMMLIAEGLKRAKFKEKDPRAKKAAAIQQALAGIKDYNGLMGKLSIDENGNVTFPLFMKKMVNGKAVKAE